MSYRKQTLIARTSLLLILSAIITCGCMTSTVNTPARGEDVINPEMEGILKREFFSGVRFYLDPAARIYT